MQVSIDQSILSVPLTSSTCVCVCLTIFVPILSSGADPASKNLDVFAAGAAVELVYSVVSATHGVSHLCLVLHMHTEVHSIHTNYLLGVQIDNVTNKADPRSSSN